MDPPSAQLALDIRASLQQSFSTRRPLLHHLNADTSWLLQIPLSQPTTPPTHAQRHWFNILIDPWLSGSQSDVASWFSQQRHAVPSAVPSIAAVEELAREIEILSSELRSGKRDPAAPPAQWHTLIDVLAISHEFTDHCHKATLLQCHRSTPVLATRKAAALVRAWKHFDTVLETPAFPDSASTDWRRASVAPLPEWLGVARLTAARDALYYHSALLFFFKSPPGEHGAAELDGGSAAAAEEEEGTAEVVIYTPHGVHARDLAIIKEASPRVRTLAFLHGLHDITISGNQLNLGAHNGLEAQRMLNAKYWIGTHDEIKHAGGLVKWLLRRKVISLKEALEYERAKKGAAEKSDFGGMLEDVEFLDLPNGGSTILS